MERYYYTEYKRKTEMNLRAVQERLRQQETFSQLPKQQMKKADEVFNDRMMPSSAVCMLANLEQYQQFLKLSDECIALAKEAAANLLIDTEELTGCISFVGDEMSFTREAKFLFERLHASANEVYIAASADTGNGSPTDVDGAVRIEFWFDFYAETEME